jgi:hypothetical protein
MAPIQRIQKALVPLDQNQARLSRRQSPARDKTLTDIALAKVVLVGAKFRAAGLTDDWIAPHFQRCLECMQRRRPLRESAVVKSL